MLSKKIRKSKLYTRTGDPKNISGKYIGMTSLYDGSRKPKYNYIFKVLGQIDLVSSHIGLIWSILNKKKYKEILKYLRVIQVNLQTIASSIATINRNKKSVQEITDNDLKKIEFEIDFVDNFNSPIKAFILPGVTKSDSYVNITRCHVRKLETSLYNLDKTLETPIVFSLTYKYINRLSDYLYALARYICKKEGFEDYFA